MTDASAPATRATPPVVTQIISKRATTKLADLQHQLHQEVALLATHHSRFMGALLACDQHTQRTMMLEYRERLHVVHSILTKLCMTIDRCGDLGQE